MKLKSYYPVEIDVDGEAMMITVKRLTFTEGSELRSKLREVQNAEERSGDNSAENLSEELVKEAITQFVKVDSEVVLEDEDGKETSVKTGEQLIDAFGGRQEVLLAIYSSVLHQNILTPSQKKVSKSPTDSSPSSGGSGKDPVGPKQVMTAKDVVSEAFANIEAAMSLANTLSGLTDPRKRRSSSTSAPFYH